MVKDVKVFVAMIDIYYPTLWSWPFVFYLFSHLLVTFQIKIKWSDIRNVLRYGYILEVQNCHTQLTFSARRNVLYYMSFLVQ